MTKTVTRYLFLVGLVFLGVAGAWWVFTALSSTTKAVVTARTIHEGEITQISDFRIVDVSAQLIGERDRLVVEYEPGVTEEQIVGVQAKATIPEGIPPAPDLFREPEVAVPPNWRLIRLPVSLVEPSQPLRVGDHVDVYSTDPEVGILTPGVFHRGADQLRWYPTPVDALGLAPDADLLLLLAELQNPDNRDYEDAPGANIVELYGHCWIQKADATGYMALSRPEVGLGLEVVRVWETIDEAAPSGIRRETTLLVPVELFPELLILSAAHDLRMVVLPDGEPLTKFTPEDIDLVVSAQADAYDIDIADPVCRELWEEGLFFESTPVS